MLRDPSMSEQEHTAYWDATFDTLAALKDAFDPEAGDPAGWPAWTDDDRWEIPADVLDRGERAEEEAPYEPAADDRLWWAVNGPGLDQAEPVGGAVFSMELAELLAAGRID